MSSVSFQARAAAKRRCSKTRFHVRAPENSVAALVGDLATENDAKRIARSSSFDLGEDLGLVLLSVTEGEDKPLKYPTTFNTADVAIVTKTDFAAAAEFDLGAAQRTSKPCIPETVLELSSKTGAGMDR